jgi:hypothetical protein
LTFAEHSAYALSPIAKAFNPSRKLSSGWGFLFFCVRWRVAKIFSVRGAQALSERRCQQSRARRHPLRWRAHSGAKRSAGNDAGIAGDHRRVDLRTEIIDPGAREDCRQPLVRPGRGSLWEYRYTSPTQFKEMEDGKRKYKRRQRGLGSAKLAKGGLALVEAREEAAKLAKQVREGIDPIDAAKTAKFENEVRAGEALTVFDAMTEYREKVFDHKPLDYRRKNRRFLDRINNGLGTIPIRTIAENPQLIVDKLGMRERWRDHRDVEEHMLFQLRTAINRVMVRCKVTNNPAVVKGCLEFCGLDRERTKPRGYRIALPYEDVGRLIKRIRERVTTRPGTNPVGQRSTLSYALEFLWLTTVREGEVFQAQWKEFDERPGHKIWVAPIEHLKKVKGGTFPRPVPITKPMQDILDAMRARHKATRGSDASPDDLVFPSPAPDKNGERWKDFKRISIIREQNLVWPEYKIHPHGNRTSIRTWAKGPGKYDVYLVDRQHNRREPGTGGAHYSSHNRPELDDETLDDRGHMMKDWCLYCDQVNPLSAASERIIRNQKAK